MSIRERLRGQFVRTCAAEPVALAGKHAIVTGATEGSLGYETALALARWGALVVVTTRGDPSSVVAALRRDAGEERVAPEIDGHPLDLTDAGSVTAFAEWYQRVHGARLDILVNNAGVHLDLMSEWKEPKLSADGNEIHWRTNYLGTTHLTHTLLPLLQQTGDDHGDARIVNVVSQLHSKANNENLFEPVEPYDSWKSYARSKLAVVHFTYESQRRFAQQNNLQSYCLHPGGVSGVSTNIARKGVDGWPRLERLRKLGAPLERFFMASAREGAQTQIHCATAPGAVGGHYYLHCAIGEAAPDTSDEDVADRLWSETAEWLDQLEPVERRSDISL